MQLQVFVDPHAQSYVTGPAVAVTSSEHVESTVESHTSPPAGGVSTPTGQAGLVDPPEVHRQVLAVHVQS